MAVVLAAASVVVRLRRARGAERQQLKWFAYVGVLAATCLTVAVISSAFAESSDGFTAVAVTGWLTGLALSASASRPPPGSRSSATGSTTSTW